MEDHPFNPADYSPQAASIAKLMDRPSPSPEEPFEFKMDDAPENLLLQPTQSSTPILPMISPSPPPSTTRASTTLPIPSPMPIGLSSATQSYMDHLEHHVLPIAACPTLEQFQQLRAYAVGLATINDEPSSIVLPSPATTATSPSSSSSSASHDQLQTRPPLSISELFTLMLDWIRALFMDHDHALSSGALYQLFIRAFQRIHPTQRIQPTPSPSHMSPASPISPISPSSRSSASSTSTRSPSTPSVSSSVSASPLPPPSPAVPSPPWVLELAARLRTYPYTYIQNIEYELTDLQRTCGTPVVDNSWTCSNDGSGSAGIATWYRKEPGSQSHSFLVSGRVQAPMFNCLAMIKEADLLHNWLPALKEADMTMLNSSRYRMQLRVVLEGIWPLQDREAILYGYGDVVGKCVGVYFRSQRENEVIPGSAANGSDVVVKPVDPNAPSVRVQVKNGGFWFEKIDAHTTHVRALFNVDPKLPVIPYWFLNGMSSRFCGTIISQIRKKAPGLFLPDAKTFAKSQYQLRVEQNARVYDDITRRLHQAEVRQAKQQHQQQQQQDQRHAKIIHRNNESHSHPSHNANTV